MSTEDMLMLLVSMDWLCVRSVCDCCGAGQAKILTVLDLLLPLLLLILMRVFLLLRKVSTLVQRSLPRVYTKMLRLKARLPARRAIWKKPQFEAASGEGDLSAKLTEVVKNNSIVNSLHSSR